MNKIFKCRICGLNSYSIFCYSCNVHYDITYTSSGFGFDFKSKSLDEGYEDLICSCEKLYET